MCSNACPAPDPAANLGCSSLWTCSSCQMDCGQAATALVFTGNLMQGEPLVLGRAAGLLATLFVGLHNVVC